MAMQEAISYQTGDGLPGVNIPHGLRTQGYAWQKDLGLTQQWLWCQLLFAQHITPHVYGMMRCVCVCVCVCVCACCAAPAC
jgi:hypothetical protein